MFTQTNPTDNPQPGDKDRNPDGSRIAPPVAGPGDRPIGALGVDRPHGGGSTGTEQMALARAPADAQPVGTQPGPGHNPNNPQDTNNPFSTSTGPANRDNPLAGYATGSSPAEMTTDPLPTRNEQVRQDIKDAKKSKKGKAKKAKSKKAKSASSRTKRTSAAKSRSKSGSKAKARKRSS
jgi:hypothetical protein